LPRTLYLYILRELLKVMVLTTAVLVTVMSFGAAIKPLSDGLLEPLTLVKFVLFTMPTVLGFALPFAGAFSATVVYSRLASDNEILACCAGGLSYRRVLMPVAGLGAILMVAMLLLSNTVVPGFWKAAKKTVEGDVLALLVGQLNQDKPYSFGDEGLVLYAQSAAIGEKPASDQLGGLIPEQRIDLFGVVFGRMGNATGQVESDTTARRATAILARDPISQRAYVLLTLIEPVHFNAQADQVRVEYFQAEHVSPPPIYLANPVDDEAVFFSLPQLAQLRRNPESYDLVKIAMGDLRSAIGRQQLRLDITRQITQNQAGQDYITLQGGLEYTYYRISAPIIREEQGRLILEAAQDEFITVEVYDNAALSGGWRSGFEAAQGQIRIATDELSGFPEALLSLQGVGFYSDEAAWKQREVRRFFDTLPPEFFLRRWLSLSEERPNNKTNHTFGAMGQVDAGDNTGLESMTPDELGQIAKLPEFHASVEVREARQLLAYQIMLLTLNISGQIQSRMATAVACPLLLLLGGVLSIRLKGRSTLVVFFWSFLLALTTLLMIYTGLNLSNDLTAEHLNGATNYSHFVGLAILWGGNLSVLILIGRIYCKIART